MELSFRDIRFINYILDFKILNFNFYYKVKNKLISSSFLLSSKKSSYQDKTLARDSPKCRACQEPRETIQHLLFKCRAHREARTTLYQALRRHNVPLPTAAEDEPEARLFAEPRATQALLQFITDIGCLRAREEEVRRVARLDTWGLDALENAARVGEG